MPEKQTEREVRTARAEAGAARLEATEAEKQSPRTEKSERETKDALREAAKKDEKAADIQERAEPKDTEIRPDFDADRDLLERQIRTLQAEATALAVEAKDYETGPKAYRDKANACLREKAAKEQQMLELQEELRHADRTAEERRSLRERRQATKKEEERREREMWGRPPSGGEPGIILDKSHGKKSDERDYEEVKVKVYRKDQEGPHRYHKDIETNFDDMDVVVVPKDTSYGYDDKHASEPDWNKGWYLQNRATGQPVEGWNVDGGPPPLALRQAWRDSRTIKGLLLFHDAVRHN